MGTLPSDNQRKLAFVLHALGLGCKNNRLAGANDRRRRLEKDERFLRYFIAELRRMRRIIPPDANDLPRFDRRHQANVCNRPRARPLRPRAPGRPGDIADVLSLKQAINRKGGLRSARSKWHEA